MAINTAIPKNNFSSGQIDRDLKGRFDLPLYQNGFEISRNFFHTIKGDCYYRCGFEFIDEIGNAALYEFKFNNAQSYLLVFTTSNIEFWSYNQSGELVRVIDNNNQALTISHPYGDEIFNLSMTQNCDILYITHKRGEFAEYQLKRTASNAFTLSKTAFTNTGTASLSSNSATENHGFPKTCAFYENRLTRCSSSKFPTYLYGSKGAEYNNITTGTGTNDGYQFDLAEANSDALWLISGVNSLLVGTAEGIITVNGGSTTTAITPTNISAKLSCRDGVSSVSPIHKDNFVFFVSSNKRMLYMFEYDVLMEQFKATNLSKGNYEITKGGIIKITNKYDRFNLLFALCNGKLLSVCFSNDESVNSWSEFTTKGEFIDVCSITRPDGNSDLFVNVKRKINGNTKYYLEKLSDMVEFSRKEDFISDVDNFSALEKIGVIEEDNQAFYRKIAEELKGCNYLDSSMSYSGLHTETITLNENTLSASSSIFTSSDVGRRIWVKSTTGKEYGILDIAEYINESEVNVNVLVKPTQNTINEWYLSATTFSGLNHLEGETVSVVGNGGYIGDFVVENGQIDISSANTNKVGTAVIGLRYKGILKSPNLGLFLDTTQTYTCMKNIYKMGLELSFSSGGQVGEDLYEMNKVQDFNPDGLFDCPPLPINSYTEILISGAYSKDKHFYVVQNEPLPFHIEAIVPYTKHISKT